MLKMAKTQNLIYLLTLNRLTTQFFNNFLTRLALARYARLSLNPPFLNHEPFVLPLRAHSNNT